MKLLISCTKHGYEYLGKDVPEDAQAWVCPECAATNLVYQLRLWKIEDTPLDGTPKQINYAIALRRKLLAKVYKRADSHGQARQVLHLLANRETAKAVGGDILRMYDMLYTPLHAGKVIDQLR